MALGGQAQVFADHGRIPVAMAKLSVEVMVLLFGTLTLWLGFCASQKRPALWMRWPGGYRPCLRG